MLTDIGIHTYTQIKSEDYTSVLYRHEKPKAP